MDARRWSHRVTALTALISTILIGVAGAQAELTVKGDTAAWSEIEAAYKKLDALVGYRKKSSGVTRIGAKFDRIFEVAPPNSQHITTESQPSGGFPGMTVEEVVVSDQTRTRYKTAGKQWEPWHCPRAAPPVQTPSDPIQATVEATRGPDTTIEGRPVRTYFYTIVSTITFPDKRQNTGTVRTTLYVDAQTGMPRREVEVIIGPNNQDLTPTTTDFYDYDAKIEITLPPCG